MKCIRTKQIHEYNSNIIIYRYIDIFFIKVSPCKHEKQYNTKNTGHSLRVMRDCNNYINTIIET